MLWNLVYDFFVQYIFGGVLSTWNTTTSSYDYVTYYSKFSVYTGQNIGNGDFFINIFNQNITLGNYMSFIATIISMILILLIIGHFIKKAFNLFGRII